MADFTQSVPGMQKKFQNLQIRLARYRRVRMPRHIRQAKLMSRHPYAVPIITIGSLLVLTGLIYFLVRQTSTSAVVPDTKIVIISHDHVRQTVPTREMTVGRLLKKLDIQLRQGDVVEPAADTAIDQDAFRVNIYRAVPVEIIDGSKKSFTYSAATTPRSIAQQAGSSVFPEDVVTTTPAQDFLASGSIGEQVIINRAVPVDLNLYGSPLAVRTHAATVGAMIKQKGITLAKDDQVMPAPSTALSPGLQVFIVRHGTKIESVAEMIPMPIQTIQDPSLAYGTNAVRQVGSAGQKVTTYQVELQNGKVVGRTVIQTVITQAAVTEIVVIGTSLSGIKGDMALAGISPNDYNAVDYIVSHESGWCPTKAQGQYGGCPPYAGFVPSTGGYGLCQSTPGSKMASAGADWATNPVTQLRWCSGYAASRYGGWANAYSHWLSYHNW